MRPGQNKRIRGRNGRKGPNPLTRSFESNGPDVKIRGTAQHIAEKYLQLARDAQSSGDTIMAESLLQHAEHYFRLIAAAQQQGRDSFGRQVDSEPELEEEEDDFVSLPDRFAPLSERLPQPAAYQPQPYQPQPYAPQPRPQPPIAQPQPNFTHQPQPYEERPPMEQRFERPARGDRGFRDRGRDRGGERPAEGGERPYSGFDRGREGRRFQPMRQDNPQLADTGDSNKLPSFITAPVRNPNLDLDSAAGPIASPERPAGADPETVSYRPGPRRRRPFPPPSDQTSAVAAQSEEPPASD